MKLILSLVFLFIGNDVFARAKGPFVLPQDLALETQDQKVFIGTDEYSISKPSLIFQLGLNNKDNHRTVTVTNLKLTTLDSSNEEVIELRPNIDFYKLSENHFINIYRDYFFEVPPYQSTACMDKVEYFKESSYQRSCEALGKDTLTILNYGVSALNTVESEDQKSCCPGEASCTQMLYIIAPFKPFVEEDPNSSNTKSFKAILRLQGFYGTFANPEADYDEKIDLIIKRP